MGRPDAVAYGGQPLSPGDSPMSSLRRYLTTAVIRALDPVHQSAVVAQTTLAARGTAPRGVPAGGPDGPGRLGRGLARWGVGRGLVAAAVRADAVSRADVELLTAANPRALLDLLRDPATATLSYADSSSTLGAWALRVHGAVAAHHVLDRQDLAELPGATAGPEDGIGLTLGALALRTLLEADGVAAVAGRLRAHPELWTWCGDRVAGTSVVVAMATRHRPLQTVVLDVPPPPGREDGWMEVALADTGRALTEDAAWMRRLRAHPELLDLSDRDGVPLAFWLHARQADVHEPVSMRADVHQLGFARYGHPVVDTPAVGTPGVDAGAEGGDPPELTLRALARAGILVCRAAAVRRAASARGIQAPAIPDGLGAPPAPSALLRAEAGLERRHLLAFAVPQEELYGRVVRPEAPVSPPRRPTDLSATTPSAAAPAAPQGSPADRAAAEAAFSTAWRAWVDAYQATWRAMHEAARPGGGTGHRAARAAVLRHTLDTLREPAEQVATAMMGLRAVGRDALALNLSLLVTAQRMLDRQAPSRGL